jgi:predicted DNA-binding protein YlxM (UPF0122 family)
MTKYTKNKIYNFYMESGLSISGVADFYNISAKEVADIIANIIAKRNI